ncbi:MAG: hypothetical protein RL701_2485 [Pseudomonadota bacterium]
MLERRCGYWVACMATFAALGCSAEVQNMLPAAQSSSSTSGAASIQPTAGAAGSVAVAAAGRAGSPPSAAGQTAAPTVGAAGSAGESKPPALVAGSSGSTSAVAGRTAGAMAGRSAAAGSGGGAGGVSGGNLSGVTTEELAMLRQTCVDTINMYRATLPALNLKPLNRATPDQETCSDKGAQQDGDSGEAHGSARAGLCRAVGLGAENTCPGWGVGGRTGNATLADALKGCLKAMWAEGEPPVTRDMCVQDLNGCFQAHGHYLNMSGSGASAVACSFYKMKDGQYWMNQDFTNR